MTANSKIEWTDHTFNPWWGCSRVSPGCEHCYAEAFAKRTGHPVWGTIAPRRFFGAKHWAEPRRWNEAAQRLGVRRRVFCASMADVFEPRPDLDEARNELYSLILATPALDWLLLTKRPEWIRELWPAPSFPQNVWLGVTAENQEYAERRIPVLLGLVGPRVRFVSYEPALGPINLAPFMTALLGWSSPSPRVDWVIVGGESGGGARAFDLEWARRAVAQCSYAGVPCFVKQLGANPGQSSAAADAHGSLIGLRSRKGGDPAEWPSDLRVRQFPEVRP